MAAHFADQRSLVVNGTDLSEFVVNLEVTVSHSVADTTTTQDVNKTSLAGKAEYQATIEFQQDYTTITGLHTVVQPLIGTAVACTMKPTDGGTTAYTGDFLLAEFTPIPGGTGDDIATFSVTWPAAGAIAVTL